MAISPTQAARSMAMSTPLGVDALLLDSFSCTKDLSHPFRLTAIVSSAKPASIRIQRRDSKFRPLGGIGPRANNARTIVR